MQAEDCRYLQVRNAKGELLGLMAGNFPAQLIRRGRVCFVLGGSTAYVSGLGSIEPVRYESVEMQIEWWGRNHPGRHWPEYWPCLVTDLTVEELRQIGAFR